MKNLDKDYKEIYICCVERINGDLELFDVHFGKILVKETKLCYKIIGVLEGEPDKILNGVGKSFIKKRVLEMQPKRLYFGPTLHFGWTRQESVGALMRILRNEINNVTQQMKEIGRIQKEIREFGQESSYSDNTVLHGAGIQTNKYFGCPKEYSLKKGSFKIKECPKTYKLKYALNSEYDDSILVLYPGWMIHKDNMKNGVGIDNGSYYAWTKKELVEPILNECRDIIIELCNQRDNYRSLLGKLNASFEEKNVSEQMEYAG